MRSVVAAEREQQSANHRYHLSQFGSSAEEVLDAFAFYCRRFNLPDTASARQEHASRSIA
jgi:hypothetical protein